MADEPQHTDDRKAGLWFGLLLAGMVVVGGVGATLYARGPWWLPSVVSVHGVEIDRLFYSTLIITGAVFIMVQLGLALLVWRYAASSRGRAAYWHDNRTLELTYTIVPAIALAIMVSMGGVVWARVHRAAPADATFLEVRAEQFTWRTHYPGKDGRLGRLDPQKIDERANPLGLDPGDAASADDIVSSELHMVVNKPIRIVLRSRDVIHSFFLTEFRVKQDAVPGVGIEVWFVPTQEGQYEIACAELCGVGHYTMRGTAKVESQEAYDAWLAQQKPALPPKS